MATEDPGGAGAGHGPHAEAPWPWAPQEVCALLTRVEDPEVGMNIVDLGLVYDVLVHPVQGVRVRMTMTSAACPMAQMLIDDVHDALERGLPTDTPVEVELVWEPPWTPARMSPHAREVLGWEDDSE